MASGSGICLFEDTLLVVGSYGDPTIPIHRSICFRVRDRACVLYYCVFLLTTFRERRLQETGVEGSDDRNYSFSCHRQTPEDRTQ